jgi:hypothetical protein
MGAFPSRSASGLQAIASFKIERLLFLLYARLYFD